jgi:hypothetical protein
MGTIAYKQTISPDVSSDNITALCDVLKEEAYKSFLALKNWKEALDEYTPILARVVFDHALAHNPNAFDFDTVKNAVIIKVNTTQVKQILVEMLDPVALQAIYIGLVDQKLANWIKRVEWMDKRICDIESGLISLNPHCPKITWVEFIE